MSAKKIITYVDLETGEIFTGTVTEIAIKLKITPQAMYKRLSTKTDTINQLSTDPKVDSVNPEKVEPKSEPALPIFIPNLTEHVYFKTDRYVPDGATVTPDGRIILQKGNCIDCNQPTYHKINGQFQCLNACTTKHKTKKVLYVPRPCADGTHPYIKELIERVQRNYASKHFDPVRRWEPSDDYPIVPKSIKKPIPEAL